MVERVWVKDTSWMLLGRETSVQCRMLKGAPHKRKWCPNTAVAQFRRSNGWWAYCADHLYGRRIAGDHIEVSVSADSPAALRGAV